MGTSAINQALFFTRNALRSIDADAVEQYNIPSIVLMENAARSAATIILESTDAAVQNNIVILCGRGNNGGDGYGVARHLANAGCHVSILQLGEPRGEDAKVNASICAAMHISQTSWIKDAHNDTSLFIDAIFGTGLDRTVTGDYADAIHACNEHSAPCISLDIPSGLDCDSGLPLGCCIEATMTISFVGMKLGFQNESAERVLGEVVIADIGCPQALLHKYGSTTT